MWFKTNLRGIALFAASFALLFVFAVSPVVHAYVPPSITITPIKDPVPVNNSFGLVAVRTQPPPSVGATISTPGNGASYSTSPITVAGICPTGLLVEVYDNGVMVGAVNCANGSFSVQVSLFTGQNALQADDYDDLGQGGPLSNIVTVSYNNSHFTTFGQLVTLTSDYGRRAADTGTDLTWPLLLSGGNGPYAFSINWGDNTPNQLKSVALSGTINIDHIYKSAGIYRVTVQVTDVNGVSAFLQVVAVSNGNVTSSSNSTNGGSSNKGNTTSIPKVVWEPAAASTILLIPAYWLGRKSEIRTLRKKLEKEMESYHGE